MLAEVAVGEVKVLQILYQKIFVFNKIIRRKIHDAEFTHLNYILLPNSILHLLQIITVTHLLFLLLQIGYIICGL